MVDGKKTIKVHKLILTDRCPLFADVMLESETMEITKRSSFAKSTLVGSTKDIEHVFQELLIAPGRYQMEGLKRICYENVISKMNVYNNSDLLKFVLANQFEELKAFALNYFKKYAKALIQT